MKADVAQQRLVLELADLDAEIGRLDHRLKNLPEQSKLEAAQSAHHEANDRLAVVQLALADIDAQIAKFESEIDGVRQREDRDRRLLEGGTVDAKQLTEIQHELDTLERRQASLEDSLLEVMERREELAADQDRELAGIDDLQSAMTDAQRNCDSARTHLAQLAHQARSRREELVALIDESLVSMYERQRARGGTGAATLQGRRCGACRLEIDRGELARIAAAPDDEVLRCPECSAILLRVKGRWRVKVLIEADGGSRGNPGPAGYGAVVWSPDRAEVLAEAKESIGRATNNVAEYRGLIAGLEAAGQVGATDVEVRMDSKLVVEQMSGRWRVKHPDLAALHRQAQERAAAFASVSYTWIPREQNSAADALANQAMDGAAESEAVKVNPAGWTGAKGAPTRLMLLRHGQTPLSVERRYSGRGNPDLTELGVRQASAAAAYLSQVGGIDAVVSSPLQRARDTAAAAAGALGLDVEVDDDLIETDFGAWEGLTFLEASERDPELHRRWLADTAVAPPGGESFDAVARRITRVQQRLLAERAGQTVLVVSHVTPIKTLLRVALDAGPAILYRLHLDLASLSIAEFYPDGAASVRLVNQTAYL